MGHGYTASPGVLAEYSKARWDPDEDRLLEAARRKRPLARKRPEPIPPAATLAPGPAAPADEVAEQQLLAVALRGEVRPAQLELDPRWFSTPLNEAIWAVLLTLDEAPCRVTHHRLLFGRGGRPLVKLDVVARLVLGIVGGPALPAAVMIYLAYHRDRWAADRLLDSAARVRELHRRRWMIARLQRMIGGWLWDVPPGDDVLEQTARRLEQMTVDGSHTE